MRQIAVEAELWLSAVCVSKKQVVIRDVTAEVGVDIGDRDSQGLKSRWCTVVARLNER